MDRARKVGEKNPLVVLLSVWNEIEWVEKALAQIVSMNPKEILIADGCFDSSIPVRSSDGTREKLETFALSRPNVRVFEAKRRSRLQHIMKDFDFFRKARGRVPSQTIYRFLRRWALSTYRLNQAATLNFLMSESRTLAAGDFFMTVDVDEFYSPEVIARLRCLCRLEPYDFLTFREVMLLGGPKRIAPFQSASAAKTINIPLRFTGKELFMYTRSVWRFDEIHGKLLGKPLPDWKDSGAYLGEVFHCKYRPETSRHELAYELGDRRAPGEK